MKNESSICMIALQSFENINNLTLYRLIKRVCDSMCSKNLNV